MTTERHKDRRSFLKQAVAGAGAAAVRAAGAAETIAQAGAAGAARPAPEKIDGVIARLARSIARALVATTDRFSA